MPIRLQIDLAGPPPRDEGVNYRHANGLRALVYDALARMDAEFAREMHADTWPKPLTLSPLWWRDGGWVLDISVLWDPLGGMLLQGLAKHEPLLRLGREQYQLQQVQLGASATVEELINQATPVSRLMVDFLTPTTFHDTLLLDADTGRKTKIGYPLPDPARMVTSWFHKWNCLMSRMALAPIPDTFLDLLPRLALARMAGETHVIHLSDKQSLVGFSGSAVFDILDAVHVPVQFTATLGLLAAFANFAGTGVETMRGMGQTRAGGG